MGSPSYRGCIRTHMKLAHIYSSICYAHINWPGPHYHCIQCIYTAHMCGGASWSDFFSSAALDRVFLLLPPLWSLEFSFHEYFVSAVVEYVGILAWRRVRKLLQFLLFHGGEVNGRIRLTRRHGCRLKGVHALIMAREGSPCQRTIQSCQQGIFLYNLRFSPPSGYSPRPTKSPQFTEKEVLVCSRR